MEIKTAGNILKLIALRNGFKNNKAIAKHLGVYYDKINRGLRDDALISDDLLETFYSHFKDVSIQEKQEIRILVDLSKTTDTLRNEFYRLKNIIEILENKTEENETQKILRNAIEIALKNGLLNSMLDIKKLK